MDPQVGWIVRAARIRSGLTQAQLAKEAGLCRRSIVGIERGRNCTVAVLSAVIAQLPEARRNLARLLLQ